MLVEGAQSALNWRVTARQITSDKMTVHRKRPKPQTSESGGELTELVPSPSLRAGCQPRSLSGIQRKSSGRPCARAAEPPVLITDEAVFAMDVSVQLAVLNLLVELSCELNFYTQISRVHLTMVTRPLSSAWVRSPKQAGLISSSHHRPNQRRRPQAARSSIDARRSFEFCASQNPKLNRVCNRAAIGVQQITCDDPLAAIMKEDS
jgi:hypothetical protein